jgi:WD40 repeat protein
MAIPDYDEGQLSQCSLAFSPDSRLLVGACGENRVPVWDVHSGRLVFTLYDTPVQIVTCAFSPDGKLIACGGFDHTVTLFDATTGEAMGSFLGHTAPIWDIAFHPDGKSLVSCSLGLLGGGGGRGDVRLWDALTGQAGWVYSGSRDYLSLALHPAGTVAAYGSIGGGVGILDPATGAALYELTDSHRNIGGVAYSPAGRWLAAGSDDKRIYLWSASDHLLDTRLEGHTGYVNGVAFSPNVTSPQNMYQLLC